jgi:hypothetical protein
MNIRILAIAVQFRMFTVVGCGMAISISIVVSAFGLNELGHLPGDFRTLIVLQEVACLRKPRMRLAFGTGNVIDQVVLSLTTTEVSRIVGCPDGQERLLVSGQAGPRIIVYARNLVDQ